MNGKPQDLLPCPFCGSLLESTGVLGEGRHPSGECVLSDIRLYARQVRAWNRRSPARTLPAQGGELTIDEIEIEGWRRVSRREFELRTDCHSGREAIRLLLYWIEGKMQGAPAEGVKAGQELASGGEHGTAAGDGGAVTGAAQGQETAAPAEAT